MNRPTAALSMLALLAASCSKQQEAAEQNETAPAGAAQVETSAQARPDKSAGARPGDTSVPVMIGGEPQLDACATAAVVSGLEPAGNNFLSVRKGPGPSYAETDRLANGQRIAVCDGDGQWLGVIYARDGADCGLASPVTPRARYSGPCRWGWVAAQFVTVTAG